MRCAGHFIRRVGCPLDARNACVKDGQIAVCRFLRGLKSIKCPSVKVSRAQQRIERDIDFIRVAEKVITIGIGQTLGIHKALKAGFRLALSGLSRS